MIRRRLRIDAHDVTDADYGRVRVVSPDGSAGRDVVTTPGNYTEPAFSPDGKWIVFRDAGTDGTRGPLYGSNAGIYVVPVDGSSVPKLVREGGTEPSFDSTGKRIFVNDSRQGKAVLVSVGIGGPDSPLSGGDDIVHFQSENATEIVPSPDGKWVAFAERWHAFVAPFPHTGRPIDLSPTMEGYPTARISRTRASTSTGRVTAARSTGPWGRNCSRATSRGRSRFWPPGRSRPPRGDRAMPRR